jgi:hypothetical protein
MFNAFGKRNAELLNQIGICLWPQNPPELSRPYSWVMALPASQLINEQNRIAHFHAPIHHRFATSCARNSEAVG